MGGYQLTLAYRSLCSVLLLAGLGGACGFDSSVNLPAPSGGGDSALPDADASVPSPDAMRELGADASTSPDANPSFAMGTLGSSPLQGSIELDGVLDAQWLALDFKVFDIDDAEQLEASSSYSPDASVRFASLYDSENIYFFFQVFDDVLVDDSSDIYNDDSIEIYIDGLNDGAGPYASDDHWITMSAGATYQSFGPNNIAITGDIRETDEGYTIEIALDRSDLGAGAATELGFNLGINDDDGAGNTDVDAYGLWFMPDTPSCQDCCSETSSNYAWCDTSRLGALKLIP